MSQQTRVILAILAVIGVAGVINFVTNDSTSSTTSNSSPPNLSEEEYLSEVEIRYADVEAEWDEYKSATQSWRDDTISDDEYYDRLVDQEINVDGNIAYFAGTESAPLEGYGDFDPPEGYGEFHRSTMDAWSFLATGISTQQEKVYETKFLDIEGSEERDGFFDAANDSLDVAREFLPDDQYISALDNMEFYHYKNLEY